MKSDSECVFWCSETRKFIPSKCCLFKKFI